MDGCTIFILISGILALIYSSLVLIQLAYWNKIPDHQAEPSQANTSVSVIIAMRNEEKHILSCLQSLYNQTYPGLYVEVIIIDDHSTDQSVKLVHDFIEKNKPGFTLRILELKDKQTRSSYKKYAISEGIRIATGELIVTTDADCTACRTWLSSIVSFYETNHSVMIMGPVIFKSGDSFFSDLQAFEFAGLIGMSASSNQAGFPLMCNGANLAYSKSAFDEISGFGDTPAIASGDDTFLLFKLKDKFPDRIHFIKSPAAMVETFPQQNLSSFFTQRKRWASKTTRYNRNYITATGLLIYFFNLSLLTMIFLTPFIHSLLLPLLFMLVVKFFSEGLFMHTVCKFFKMEHLFWIFLPASLLFVPYIVTVGMMAPFGSYEWKGRTVK